MEPFGRNKSTWQEALDLAFALAQGRLSALKPAEVAAKAGVDWVKRESFFVVPFFGHPLKVTYPEGEVYDRHGRRVYRLREVLVLHYLTQAKGTEAKGLWVDFRKLPGGTSYYPVFRDRIIVPLIRLFGQDPGRLAQIAQELQGEVLPMGDGALALWAFPRVRIAFGLYGPKEEMPPEGFVLFDAAVTDYLSTEDAVWVCHEALQVLKARTL